MITVQIPALRDIVYLLRATTVEGKEIEPIRCLTEQEAETRASALVELGYLNPRIRLVRESGPLAS